VYTKEGLAWIENTEGLKDVLARHHPEIVADWLNPGVSAFSVWASKPKPCNPIPIYFRIP
jgi:alpha-dioxygenase